VDAPSSFIFASLVPPRSASSAIGVISASMGLTLCRTRVVILGLNPFSNIEDFS
jgi:hypothetical protein